MSQTISDDRLLNSAIVEQVRQLFESQLQEEVEILFFGSQSDCPACEDTQQLLQEVSAISPKLHLSLYDIAADSQIAHKYRVDKAPGIVLAGRDGANTVDYGIRYAGIPSGHEFSSLIHSLVLVSGRDSGLSAETRAFLNGLNRPVHLQVFVTPTCPYCPPAVVLAHRMALESEWVEAEMIEATEFPELSEKFGVSGVPQTTINAGAAHLVGAAPESDLLGAIQDALKGSAQVPSQ